MTMVVVVDEISEVLVDDASFSSTIDRTSRRSYLILNLEFRRKD